jgi:hypothetical protein
MWACRQSRYATTHLGDGTMVAAMPVPIFGICHGECHHLDRELPRSLEKIEARPGGKNAVICAADTS